MLQQFAGVGMVLASPNFKQVNQVVLNGAKKAVRILAIFGDGRLTDTIQAEIKAIEARTNAEITFLVEPKEAEILTLLKEKSWDILIFAGHGKTSQRKGAIKINQKNWIGIDKLRDGLKSAIDKGLQLAVISACDGLGVANQLGEGEQLYLPQSVVMREVLPVAVAPRFLQAFLDKYTAGFSLDTAVREGRTILSSEKFKDSFPCADWLPVVMKNPAQDTLRWVELGGVSTIPPYKGLLSFQEEDQDLFFGRDKVISEWVKFLNKEHLLLVTGASGSGKSSVVLAGLVPQYRGTCSIIKMRPLYPASNPFENFAAELLRLGKNEADLEQVEPLEHQMILERELANQLQVNPQQAIAQLQDVIQQQQRPILWVIDQLEEVYSPRCDGYRQAFLDMILAVIDQKNPQVKIALTLQSLFLEQVDTPLGKRITPCEKRLFALGNDAEDCQNLQEMMIRPARAFEVEFAEGLVDTIIEDLQAVANNLPMLEFALTELWQRQRGGRIDYQAYEGIGNVAQALTDKANAVFEQLDEPQKQQARRIFVQLIQPIEKQGNKVAIRKIATNQELQEEDWELLTVFAQARLVITDKEGEEKRAQLSHEVLIEQWETLKEWIKDNWEFRRWQEWLREQMKRPDSKLLQGAALDDGLYWLRKYGEGILLAEREFVEKSEKQRKRQRRQTIAGLVTALVIVTVSGIVAVWQWQRAEWQRDIAETENLANAALDQFESGESQLDALMTAIESGERLKELVKHTSDLASYPTTLPFLALQKITSEIRNKNKFVRNDVFDTDYTFFTPDSQHIISASHVYGKVTIWNEAGQIIAEWEDPQNKKINYVSISPNGKYIATVNAGHSVHIYDLNGDLVSSEKLADYFWQGDFFSKQERIDPRIAEFSVKSDYLAIGGAYSSKVQFTDFSGKLIKEIESNAGGTIHSIKFHPNGKEVMIGNAVGVLEVYNLETLKKIKTIKAHDSRITKIEISADGNHIATLGIDQEASGKPEYVSKLWNISGEKISNLSSFELLNWNANLGDIDFSPDGQQISTVHPGLGLLNTYNSHSGKLIRQTTIHRLSGFGLSYSPDGSVIGIAGEPEIQFISASDNIFHELPMNYEVILPGDYKQSSLVNLQYTDDSKYLFATDARNGVLDIWNLEQVDPQRINLSKSRWLTLSNNGKNILRFDNGNVDFFSKEGELISTLKATDQTINIDTGTYEVFTIFSNIIGNGYVFPDYYSSSHNGQKIVTMGRGWNTVPIGTRPIYLWDLTQESFKELQDNSITQSAERVVISPDGNYIVALDNTGTGFMGYLLDGSGNLIYDLDVNDIQETGEEEDDLFSGIGILLSHEFSETRHFDENLSYENIKVIPIMQVWKNSTAIKAGLQPGDLLLEVDGQSVSEFENSLDTYQILHGELGTIAKLKIKRGIEIQEFSVEREKLQHPTSNQFIIGDHGKFSPNSKYLLTWMRGDELLFLRDLESEEKVTWNHPATILNVYPSPDNKLIAITGTDYTITLLDYSGNLIRSIKVQQSPNDLAFSPDGQRIAFLGHPNELSIWNLAGKMLAKYTIPEEGSGLVRFAPDGKSIAVGGRRVRIYPNQTLDELIATGCEWLEDYFTTYPEEKEKLPACQ
ncbi:eIF2A-related protein [Roseofilum capinflatum]|uniref:PDZ domain-containing protein n=1 Tax=Roseofilum capinflatum BLCC-M114 TaxID=3022440 RepID=A0ABT7B2K3_9CYAN|nr:PDZ domain-containing protein [Roseofilum capinflatum]MDJ1172791.1 PDZ domain-containing protein [Roseofilum capinflatum BLCC-M114]